MLTGFGQILAKKKITRQTRKVLYMTCAHGYDSHVRPTESYAAAIIRHAKKATCVGLYATKCDKVTSTKFERNEFPVTLCHIDTLNILKTYLMGATETQSLALNV